MFHNKQALIGFYASSNIGDQATLSNFSVTTSSGSIFVQWGDGSVNDISSNTPTNHTYTCPEISEPFGFWNNIQPCL